MLGKVLQADILEFIEQRQFGALREALTQLRDADLAEIIEDLPLESGAVVFRVLPREVAAETFAYLPVEVQEEVLKALSQEKVAAILNDMPPDDRTQLLEELPGQLTQRLLSLLTPEERHVAQTLLGYPEDSVGRLMTPDFVAVRPHWTVKEALAYIRQHGAQSETINEIYVVDETMRLLDDVKLRQIVMARLEQRIEDLMTREFVALRPTDDQETAVAVFRKYYRMALPVVDASGVLLGIVTLDDVLDVAEEEATEDIQKIGGMEALDEPYVATPFWQLIRKRAGWLVVLFLGEMLTATAMGHFEDEIARAVVLALFVPLIISSGGNSGSQAASLIIRALAVGELTVRDWWRVACRELASGLTLGVILGGIGFLRIAAWSAFSTIYGPHWLIVAVTIWVALIGVVLWGTLMGSMLPLFMRRIGADPAASSAPFVATLVDVTGLVIYFTVASIIMRGTLL